MLSPEEPSEEELEAAYRAAQKTWAERAKQEANLVRTIGDQIGYGRVMQACEKIWREKAIAQGLAGGELTVGPCGSFMVPCPHPTQDENGHCHWCCGSGRVTKRVREAMSQVVPGLPA